jgi:serine/threonine protein kinase
MINTKKKKEKKNNTKTNRKLLGQGTFGCVYKPAFKCSNTNTVNKKMVSKIMVNSNANNEIQNFKIIDKIDPTGKFHIKLNNVCNLLNNNKYNLINNGECEIINYKNNFKVLKFADGGLELYYYYQIIKSINSGETIPTKVNIDINILYKILIAFKNILDGLLILNKHNYCHFDIKLENIVYDSKTNTMKLIDFGVSILYDFKILKTEINRVLNKIEEYENFLINYYEVYPYELILCKYKNFKYALINHNKHNKVLNKFLSIYNNFNNIQLKDNYIFNEDVIIYYLKLIKALVNKYNNIKLAYIAFIKIIFNKLDLYSIGITIKKLIDKYNILYSKTLNNYKDINNKLLSTDFNKLNKLITKWLNGVLNPKITKRWDISKSIKEYNIIYNYCIISLKQNSKKVLKRN